MPTLTLYFDAYNTGEAWPTSPGNMVDSNTGTYASTTTSGQVQNLNSLSDLEATFGQITKVEQRGYGYKSGGVQASTLGFRPVFSAGDGPTNNFTLSTSGAWSSYYDITSVTNAPSTWTWADVVGLGCDVIGTPSTGRTVYCSRVEIRVTYDDLIVPSGGLILGGTPATISADSGGGTSASVSSPAGGLLLGAAPGTVSTVRAASVGSPSGGLIVGGTPATASMSRAASVASPAGGVVLGGTLATVATARSASVSSPAGGLLIGGAPGAVTQSGSPVEIASPGEGLILGGTPAVIEAGTTISSRAGGLTLGGSPGSVAARSATTGAGSVAGGRLGGRVLAAAAVAGTASRAALATPATGGMFGVWRPGPVVGGMFGKALPGSATGGTW